MEKRELVIQLIAQDLKHNQLILGLEHIGLHAYDDLFLHIQPLVARLMNIPKSYVQDGWGAVYTKYMDQSTDLPFDSSRAKFVELATQCLDELLTVQGEL